MKTSLLSSRFNLTESRNEKKKRQEELPTDSQAEWSVCCLASCQLEATVSFWEEGTVRFKQLTVVHMRPSQY